MTTYEVIADRDKGDDPQVSDLNNGDRATVIVMNDDPADDLVVRIERPVPTTDKAQSGGIYDTSQGQCTSTITVDGGPVRCSLAVEHDGWAHQNGATLWPILPSLHLLTREQIAEVLPSRIEIHRIICGQFGGPSTHDHHACENAANAVHVALIQNGADR